MRDTTASCKRTYEAAKARGLAAVHKRACKPVVVRPTALGGHHLVQSEGTWLCTVCRRTSRSFKRVAAQTCTGSIARKRAVKSKQLIDVGVETGAGHKLLLSGSVLWCYVCGAFSDGAAKALARACTGGHGSHCERAYARRGLLQQLKKLRAGTHPATRLPLPPPVTIDSSLAVPAELLRGYATSSAAVVMRTEKDLRPVMQAMLARVRKRQADRLASEPQPVRRRISCKSRPSGPSCPLGIPGVVAIRRRISAKTSPSLGAAVDNSLLRP